MENVDIIRSKIGDFREIITSFSELLMIENKALEAYDLEMIGNLYEQKSHTVTAYRNMVAFFIKNQELLKELTKEERQEMKVLSIGLDKLLQENDTLLKTKMETSKIVMDSIVNLAKLNSNSNSTSYGSKGKYAPLDNNSNALAINRTL